MSHHELQTAPQLETSDPEGDPDFHLKTSDYACNALSLALSLSSVSNGCIPRGEEPIAVAAELLGLVIICYALEHLKERQLLPAASSLLWGLDPGTCRC